MIEQVSAYKLVCQECGIIELKEWCDIRDTRTLVRFFGWWCAEEAQYINHCHVWNIRCPNCTEKLKDKENNKKKCKILMIFKRGELLLFLKF